MGEETGKPLPHEKNTSGTRAHTLARISLALFSLSIVLFAGSLMLWLDRPAEPKPVRRGFTPIAFNHISTDAWVADPHVEHHLAPGVDVKDTNEDGQTFHYKANPVGQGGVCFRDDGIRSAVFAVAVGDSFTFGHHVPLSDTWVSQLEQAVGADIVNLGVSNIFGSTQYTRTLQRHGLPLKPRVVLWATFVNDWLDDTLFHSWLQLRATLGSQIDFPRSRSIYDAVRRHAYVLTEGEQSALPLLDAKAEYASGGLRFTFDATSYAAQDLRLKAIAEGRRTSEDAIKEANRLAKNAEAVLIVVCIPAKEQVYHEIVKQLIPYAESQPHDTFSRTTVEFCQREGIACLDLLPVLSSQAKAGEQLYFPRDGHFNSKGHAVAAQAIEQFLRAKSLFIGKRPAP